MFLGLISRFRSSILAPTALFSLVECQPMEQCHIHPRQCRCQRVPTQHTQPPNPPKPPRMVLLDIDLANLYHWSWWTTSFCWMIVFFCYCCSISTVLHAADANRSQLLRNRSATHQIDNVLCRKPTLRRSPCTKPPPHNHELQLEWKEGKDTLKSLPTQKLGKRLRSCTWCWLAVVLKFCLISSHTSYSTVLLSLFSNFEEDEKSRAVTLEVESLLVDAKHRNDTPEEKRKLLKRCNLLSVS